MGKKTTGWLKDARKRGNEIQVEKLKAWKACTGFRRDETSGTGKR